MPSLSLAGHNRTAMVVSHTAHMWSLSLCDVVLRPWPPLHEQVLYGHRQQWDDD